MVKSRYFLVVLLIILVGLFSGCGEKHAVESDNTVESQTESDLTETESNLAETESDLAAAESTDENQESSIGIETPYGELTYPYTFEEILRCGSVDSADGAQYDFYAVLNEQEVLVYSLRFSEAELTDAGSCIGTIQKESDSLINVYLNPAQEIVSDEMTQEDKDLVYAAQETLNDIVASIDGFDGFTKGDAVS